MTPERRVGPGGEGQERGARPEEAESAAQSGTPDVEGAATRDVDRAAASDADQAAAPDTEQGVAPGVEQALERGLRAAVPGRVPGAGAAGGQNLSLGIRQAVARFRVAARTLAGAAREVARDLGQEPRMLVERLQTVLPLVDVDPLGTVPLGEASPHPQTSGRASTAGILASSGGQSGRPSPLQAGTGRRKTSGARSGAPLQRAGRHLMPGPAMALEPESGAAAGSPPSGREGPMPGSRRGNRPAPDQRPSGSVETRSRGGVTGAGEDGSPIRAAVPGGSTAREPRPGGRAGRGPSIAPTARGGDVLHEQLRRLRESGTGNAGSGAGAGTTSTGGRGGTEPLAEDPGSRGQSRDEAPSVAPGALARIAQLSDQLLQAAGGRPPSRSGAAAGEQAPGPRRGLLGNGDGSRSETPTGTSVPGEGVSIEDLQVRIGEPGGPERDTIRPPASEPPDPDAIAELVNRVLVEQARLHGVRLP